MKQSKLQLKILSTLILLSIGCADKHKSMDIVGPDLDDNLLMKNPNWGTIADKRTKDPPFPSVFCDCNSGDPDKWTTAPDCTNQDVQYNQPYGGNACPEGGHMNYFPITYECTVCWGDHDRYLDDDYNFRLQRTDRALFTGGWNWLQAEFDSDETVDDWDDTGTWWEDFHHNQVDESDDAARKAVNGKFAIVIGEAGIDLEHGCHIELHPVYAMFIHVNDDPNDDRWAFFIRNWGNEGYCGNNQIYYRNFLLQNNTMIVRIPHEHARPLSFTHNIWSISDDNNKTLISSKETKDALILTFSLDAPEEHTTIMGDIDIKWTATDKPLQARKDANLLICSGLGVNSQAENNSEETMMKSQLMKLDKSSKLELFNKISEQARRRQPSKRITIVAEKKSNAVTVPSPSESKKINYSKMIYQASDTASYHRKILRRSIVQQYLKSKQVVN